MVTPKFMSYLGFHIGDCAEQKPVLGTQGETGIGVNLDLMKTKSTGRK